jgi:inorganic triphosphatase YgiF
METVYYDTRSLALSALGYTLRKRQENGIFVCTLKTPAGNARGEWEQVCDCIETFVANLPTLGAPDISGLTETGLIPICGAKFTRIAKTLTLPEGVVELALDRGYLTGGNQKTPLFEVEVELKSGSEETLFALANAIAEEFSLKPEPKSKFQRAREL